MFMADGLWRPMCVSGEYVHFIWLEYDATFTVFFEFFVRKPRAMHVSEIISCHKMVFFLFNMKRGNL
jgi:hypothetical protein